MESFPRKLHYKIREACKIAGVKPHVLRFWETEFPALSPPKGRSGQRIYRPRDIELILEIRKLLYEEGYTIAGARRHMEMNSSMSAPEKKPKLSVRAPKPARPSTPGFLPLFDCIPIEDAPLFQEKTATPPPDMDGDHPDSEPSDRLKRVQMELENILTLLHRE